MTRHVRLRELLLGVEGTALLRFLLDGEEDFVRRRVEGIRSLVDRFDDPSVALGVDVPEMDVESGYAAWAAVYDTMQNALIRAEEGVVDELLADVPPGRALDAACGTGRHAARLAALGHDVVGVDGSSAMLDVARSKLPDVDLRVGSLTSLPVEDGSFDVATCALALTHLEDPTAAIVELARAVRSGGRVIISDAHPTFVLIQGQAMFPTAGGGFAYVRNVPHLHSTYLRAFELAGLRVRACVEPSFDGIVGPLMAQVEEAAKALWNGVPGALVWSLERTS